jgi:hypothetical protein
LWRKSRKKISKYKVASASLNRHESKRLPRQTGLRIRERMLAESGTTRKNII